MNLAKPTLSALDRGNLTNILQLIEGFVVASKKNVTTDCAGALENMFKSSVREIVASNCRTPSILTLSSSWAIKKNDESTFHAHAPSILTEPKGHNLCSLHSEFSCSRYVHPAHRT